MFRCSTLLLILFAWLAQGVVFAQHDPHRNTVRHIAADAFEKVEKELAKADANDPETHFVKMLQSIRQGNLESATDYAQAARKAGLPFDRLVAGPRDALTPLYDSDAWTDLKESHESLRLLHGPMLGSVSDQGASFWVRTRNEAKVQVKVFQQDKVSAASEPSSTSKESDFTITISVSGLKPSTNYRYVVLVDGKSAPVDNARFTTYPAQHKPAKFHIGFGGGAGYVPKWEHMWDTINNLQPAAFLMLGDNVYIDDPEHDLTQKYCYYRRQSRPEWRRLVASTSMYAIYDDHDFGTNDCIPGPEIGNPKWKRIVWNEFRRNWVNPSYGGGETQPGCWYDFYVGDVHFILLDGRYYRTRKPKPTMLGPVQKAWLMDTLKNSRGTFKVLASPVPFTEGVKPGSRDTWDGFSEEREAIFTMLEEHRIDGVILVAADRHRTDLRITKRLSGYDLYEFESSRLTNRHTHGVVKTPGLIWGYNKTCSFGLIRFDTTLDDPKVVFEAITIEGKQVHSHELSLSQLSFR